MNVAPLQLGKEVIDLHWMRLGDERVERQKPDVLHEHPANAAANPETAREFHDETLPHAKDRTFLFHVRATFLQHEDYRGRSEIRGGTRQSPRKKR